MKKFVTLLSIALVSMTVLLPSVSVAADSSPGSYGYVEGGGLIDTGKGTDAAKITFGGNVIDYGNGEIVGQWQVNFHDVNKVELDKGIFHTTSFSEVTWNYLNGDPTVGFTATGRLNGEDGWFINVRICDHGEPGVGNDTIRIILWENEDDYQNWDRYDVNTYLAYYDTWDQVGWNGPYATQYGYAGDFPDDEPNPWHVRTELDGGNLELCPLP